MCTQSALWCSRISERLNNKNKVGKYVHKRNNNKMCHNVFVMLFVFFYVCCIPFFFGIFGGRCESLSLEQVIILKYYLHAFADAGVLDTM